MVKSGSKKKQWTEQRIEQKNKIKAAKRKRESIRMMKEAGIHHDCNKCLHRKSKACLDDLLDGCEHYYIM